MLQVERGVDGTDMTDGRGTRVGYLREGNPGSRSVVPPGVWVDDSDEDDPVLRNADGSMVDTWREDYPYPERLSREEYDHEKRLLQVELVKLQYWMQDTGRRFVVIFEGRDAAGKGSTIKRFMEHLNPRAARVVALDIPTERERGQWYFQRYISHLPTAGEVVLFDRSWYNRAGVEKVMGFCTDEQYETFLRQVPQFERLLADEGVSLTKFWFSVTPASSTPGSPSARSTPCGSGSSARPISPCWTNGRPTPRLRSRCFTGPTRPRRPGP